VHDRAARAADTDWRQVLALYGLLEEVAPSPFVTLARAVALAEADGPDAAVPVLDGLEPLLGDHQRWHAVRGHVAELRGDRAGARRHYLAAAARATNLAEQRHLTRLAACLTEPPPTLTPCDLPAVSSGPPPQNRTQVARSGDRSGP
jgi:predicted RNA polymerase sigma factor